MAEHQAAEQDIRICPLLWLRMNLMPSLGNNAPTRNVRAAPNVFAHTLVDKLLDLQYLYL